MYFFNYLNFVKHIWFFFFTESPLLNVCQEKLAGVLVLYKNKDFCEVLTAHTTKSMCIAYATEHEQKVCICYKYIINSKN